MNNTENQIAMLDTRCWADALDGVKFFIKKVVKETMEEVITEKMCNVNLEDKRLTADELCMRWNIGKSTLYNWERDGRIAPLPLGGRKKVYSMKDVLNAEADGLIRIAC